MILLVRRKHENHCHPKQLVTSVRNYKNYLISNLTLSVSTVSDKKERKIFFIKKLQTKEPIQTQEIICLKGGNAG